jgi:hypothetical protein
MVDARRFLPGLSLVHGKTIIARFDGGRLSLGRRIAGIAGGGAAIGIGRSTGRESQGPTGAGKGRSPLRKL